MTDQLRRSRDFDRRRTNLDPGGGSSSLSRTRWLLFNLFGNPSSGTATLPLKVIRVSSEETVNLSFSYNSAASAIVTQLEAVALINGALAVTGSGTFPNGEIAIGLTRASGSSFTPNQFTFQFEYGGNSITESWSGGWFQTYLQYRQAYAIGITV